MIVFLSKNIVK